MDKKALIAIIVCGLIIILYYPFIFPLLSPKKVPEEVKEEVSLKEERDVVVRPEPEEPVDLRPSMPPVQAQTGIPLREVIIENNLVEVVCTNEGAALVSIKLKRFKDAEAKNVLDLLKETTTAYHPLAIKSILQEIDFQKHRYSIIEQSSDKVVFSTGLNNGLTLTKTISLPPDKYNVDMDIVLKNNTETEISLSYSVIASAWIVHEGVPSTDIASVVGIDMGNRRTKLVSTVSKEMPVRNESVGILWAGSMNKYFATILKPASSDWVAFVESQAFDAMGAISHEESGQGDFLVTMQTHKFSIPAQGATRHEYIYYVGPKKEDILDQYESLGVLLSYGWLNPISKVLLAFLNAVHRFIPNYGISIILLTIVIKAALFPLTMKSQVSMFRMQQLQPMIEQLKEKYKNDKQRLGKEQMLLFKKHGVNPMGGCLPILLQLPVFFALFRTLQLSFEMRQASFFFWITDLSRPDTLLQLPFSVPFLGNALNILPLIMTGASFSQMKLTPRPHTADPQARAQQKMMSFMPIMFAFILYHMPSGLTLYWTTSTILSIIESVVIRKSLKKLKSGKSQVKQVISR